MKIRQAQPPEFPTLARLQIQSWQDAYRGILADDYLDHRVEPDLLARWAEIRPAGDDLILVAEQQDRIMGFITVWCRPEPFIDNLHVVPGRRSKGTGRRLMQAAAAQLVERGHEWLDMQVAPQGFLWWDERQPNQDTLFASWVRLSEDFFNAIISAPVPVDLRALTALKRSPRPRSLRLAVLSLLRRHRERQDDPHQLGDPDAPARHRLH